MATGEADKLYKVGYTEEKVYQSRLHPDLVSSSVLSLLLESRWNCPILCTLLDRTYRTFGPPFGEYELGSVVDPRYHTEDRVQRNKP